MQLIEIFEKTGKMNKTVKKVSALVRQTKAASRDCCKRIHTTHAQSRALPLGLYFLVLSNNDEVN